MTTLNQAALALAMELASMAHATTPCPHIEGFGRAVDPGTSRFKACLRMEKVPPPAAPSAVAASDNGVLAILYANGLRVVRNLDMAPL